MCPRNAPFNIPWQVIIKISTNLNTNVCGGTIINRFTVLSAAKCLSGINVTNAFVQFIEAGSRDLRQTNSASIQNIIVDEIILHPNSTNESFEWTDSNIAILTLKSPLIFNEYVQPACLPDVNFEPEIGFPFAHYLFSIP